MASIYDLQEAQVDAGIAVFDLYRQGKIVTTDMVNTILLGLVGEFKSISPPFSNSISSGVIAVERSAKINLIEIDTFAQTATDDCDTVTWMGTGTANVGEIYIFILKSAARLVTFTSAGNFRPKNGSFQLKNLDSIIAFAVAPSLNLVEIARYPSTDTADTAPSSDSVYTSAAGSIPATARVLSIVALTGETLAEGQIQITAATGTAGSVAAWIDEGLGTIQIGTFSYSTASSTAAVAAGLALDINTNSTYTAIATGADEVVITAPVGTGSSANSYTLQSVVSGGVTTVDTAMGSVTLGADGSQTDQDIDTLVDGTDGPYYLKNGMATNTLTLIAGGNFVGSALPLVLAAGDFVEVLKVGSNVSVTV